MATTIEVSDGTWRTLNMAKEPGESFDEVVKRIIQENDRMKYMGGELDES